MRSLKSTTTTASTSTVKISATASAPSVTTAFQRSPWHSPVPYLFGGLAAMLGLIAFSLLILACSYWKLSGQMNGENNENRDDGEKKSGDGKRKGRVVYEEQFVVIMAGDDIPTCLAMPTCNRSAKLCSNGSDVGKAEDQIVKIDLEVVKHEASDQREEQFSMSSEQSHELHLNHHDQTKEPESSS